MLMRRSYCKSGTSGLVMGKVEFLVTVVLVLVVLSKGSFAQQQYNNQSGYSCTDVPRKTCNTFVLYRTQTKYDDVVSIAKLFNANETAVATLNKVDVAQSLAIGQPLFIPVHCVCYNTTSIANISYVIQKGDIFWDLSHFTYESLVTVEALLAVNHVDPRLLQIGQEVIIPVRCACPSSAQLSQGTTALVTYPVVNGDAVQQVGANFGVAATAVEKANGMDPDSTLVADSTLVIPITSSQPIYTAPPSPPPPGPVASVSPNQAPPLGSGKSTNTGVYVGVGVGGFAVLLIILGLVACFFVSLRRRKAQRLERKIDPETPLIVSRNPSPQGSDRLFRKLPGDPLAGMSDLVGSDRPSLFTFSELEDATNKFSEGSKLQGSVYRGVLNGQVVAIKQMKGNMSQELKILCRVHHTNLVRLVGLCVTDAEDLYLVYEYAENGSLSDCLHTDFLSKHKLASKSSSFLSWTVRVQIALDAASGLEYIHDYVNPSYVHKDVKSSNILLDEGFRAKIANFAMAKPDVSNAMMTRHIVGTYGYMAPEYLAHGLVTTKADVFAFGVVLLELLSGQEAISDPEDFGGEERCLYSSIRPIIDSPDPAASLRDWMDPVLENSFPMDAAMSMASLAKLCVEPDPTLRPSMKDITYTLSNIVNTSMEWETSAVFENTLLEAGVEAR